MIIAIFNRKYSEEDQKCDCGAENCLGWIGGEPGEDLESNYNDTGKDVDTIQSKYNQNTLQVTAVNNACVIRMRCYS